MNKVYYSFKKDVGGICPLSGKVLVLCSEDSYEEPSVPVNQLREDPNSAGITAIHATGVSAYEILDVINQIPESNIERLVAYSLEFKPVETTFTWQENRDDDCINKIIELFKNKTLKAIHIATMSNVPDSKLLIEVLNFLKNNENLTYFNFFYRDLYNRSIKDYYHSERIVRCWIHAISATWHPV